MKTKNGLLVTSGLGRATRLMIGLSLLGAVWGIPLAYSAQDPAASGPSFLCGATNRAIEKVICADPELSSRDRTLAVLFAASRVDASGKGLSQQQGLQRQWLKDRDKGCSTGDIRTCLVHAYDDRLESLAVAALFQAPDVALAELARQDSKAAPLYEAIYRYVTLDNDAERVIAVGKLIAPSFEVLHDKPWAQSISGIDDAQGVASSDKNFSAFLSIAPVGDYALTMPCSALVRRPGLSAAMASVYGSSLDGQLIRSDCKAMTPPLPKLDQLTKAAEVVQPSCQGTIRFSLGREFDRTLLLIRLHNADLWKSSALADSPNAQVEKHGKSGNTVDKPHFIAGHTALIRDASDELATYYSSHFGVPPALARKQARNAVSALISGAYNLCEWG
ncbi:hypothetical protein HX882_12565 [Pseudomonas gingeri]|uniref:Lysozyme inhibitor LprI N-terminal domain-containing protein n=1 Tax=Pseudomonas gingeri TaxID=117681 RepID=A0A7Y7XBA4_9PSED|nr:hypothetical protein [Pseudomonas gingeri]NWB96728.1 hypothetical protein [Pseudomonas gingeri]